MTDAERLLPCPFCGDSDVQEERTELSANTWPVVRCQNCGAAGPCIHFQPEKAVEEWNRRASIESKESGAGPTCDCTKYNGGQCYNCLNGHHEICDSGQGVCSKSALPPVEPTRAAQSGEGT